MLLTRVRPILVSGIGRYS